MHNLSKEDPLGHKVVYLFDEQVTNDSTQRAFDFLARSPRRGPGDELRSWPERPGRLARAARRDVLGQQLEYRWIGPGPGDAPTIVFLHEGLGCLGMWRDFPDRVASATGCGALVYSRMGYGASEPARGARPVRFMHDEALDVLPAVIEHFQLEEVVLFGHSDGASIAVIYAGARPGPVRSLVLEAPHVFVEPVCVERIARIAHEYETTRLRDRLTRYHGRNTDSMFRTWTDVWLRPEFHSGTSNSICRHRDPGAGRPG